MKDFLAKLGRIIHWIGFSASLLIALTLALSITDFSNPILTVLLGTAFSLFPTLVTWAIRFLLTGNTSIAPWKHQSATLLNVPADSSINETVMTVSQADQVPDSTELFDPRAQNYLENIDSPEKHAIWLKENWLINYHGVEIEKDDYLVMRAIARDLAEISIKNGDFDKAWGLLHEEQSACFSHANKAKFNAEQMFELISPIAIKRANLLRIEGNFLEALNQIIYGHLMGGKRTSTLKKVQTYFQRCKFKNTEFSELTEFIDSHNHAVHLREIQLFVDEAKRRNEKLS